MISCVAYLFLPMRANALQTALYLRCGTAAIYRYLWGHRTCLRFLRYRTPPWPPDSVVQSRSQAAEMFCAMVNRLSRREYQVCMLIYGGASYAQAAEQLGISVKSVDNALQRARRKLHSEGVCSNCTGILRTVSCRRNIFHGTAGKTIPARGIPSGHPRER